MPNDLQQVATTTAEHKQMSAQWVLAQHLLHLEGQTRKAASHIGVAGRQPHQHTGGDRDHRPGLPPAASLVDLGRSRTSTMRFKAAVSTLAPTRTSRPLPSSISMRSSCCARSAFGRVSDRLEPAVGEASGTADSVRTDGKARVIGMKAGAVVPVSASLANRRQRNRRLGLIPWRRATAEMFTSGRDASATIDCFSSSLHCRRVSATTAYRREKLSLDIGTDIAPVGRNRP